MRIKDGSINLYNLKNEIKKMLAEEKKHYNIDCKLIFNCYGFLSKYNYDIAIIEKSGNRNACTVEGFASNFQCEHILEKLPFKI